MDRDPPPGLQHRRSDDVVAGVVAGDFVVAHTPSVADHPIPLSPTGWSPSSTTLPSTVVELCGHGPERTERLTEKCWERLLGLLVEPAAHSTLAIAGEVVAIAVIPLLAVHSGDLRSVEAVPPSHR